MSDEMSDERVKAEIQAGLERLTVDTEIEQRLFRLGDRDFDALRAAALTIFQALHLNPMTATVGPMTGAEPFDIAVHLVKCIYQLGFNRGKRERDLPVFVVAEDSEGSDNV
jgi:hypothetical protein